MALRVGAPVRLAGVDLGTVRSIRVRPELKETPVEVAMVLNVSDELRVPSDATVLLETAGVLGRTYIDIDARSASGPPIRANGVLRAQPTVQLTTDEIIEKVTQVLRDKNCECDSKKDVAGAARKNSTANRPSAAVPPR